MPSKTLDPQPSKAGAAKQAASSYAAGGKKPSITRSAAGGAVKGASVGGAIGSVVPGVGTAVGAGVGAAVGGTGGAISGKRAKTAAQAPRSGAHRLLVAEFIVCIIILALSPIASGDMAARDWMKRGSAMCGVFLVLGLLSAAGPRAAKAAAGFGGLTALALLIDQRSIFGVLVDKMGTTGSADPNEGDPAPVPDPPVPSPGVPA